MILLTDHTYFQNKPLEVVNIAESTAIAAEADRFIRMYEPKLLQDVLGLELYNALQAALVVNPLPDNFQKLLFGDTYTNTQGRLVKWKGIIDKDDDPLSFTIGGTKNPEWLTVGATTDNQGTIIIPAGATSFTMPSWITWQPLPFRIGAGPMQQGVDFDYNMQTGLFTLLNGDSFQQGERLNVSFIAPHIGTTPTSAGYKQSFIANYIYYWYQRHNATFSTGIGEKKVSTSNTTDASAADKMTVAWNEMSQWLLELWNYLDASKTAFPDWYGIGYYELRKYKKINSLGI